MPKKYKYVLALILIIAIAVFFRFWNFNSVLSGLYQDEAMNGNDAIASLESNNFKVFYTNNNGREGMIVWLDALAIKLFGTEPWVLRLLPALAGVLAVLGLYFLTKLLFSVEIALASSFFMATGFWAVNFSRIGFRAGLMIPFLIWSFYFLLRGFNLTTSDVVKEFRRRTSNFVIAGILFGLGFYTYISYRFASVLILAFFVPYLIKCGNKKLWTGFLVFAVSAFIIALPIGLYFLNNPGDFFGRTSQVSIFSADNPIKAVALSVASTLGMFNIVGDFNWRHNYAGSPQLFLPVGILFLIGLGVSVKRLPARSRLAEAGGGFSEKFMLIWFFIFLLPNILTTEGNPHALRALGAMPAAMIFAGVGLIWIYKKIQNYLDDKIKNPTRYDLVNFLRDRISVTLRIKKEIFWLLIVFLIFVAGGEYNKYFVKWASNINTAAAFSQNQVVISDYLNNLSKDTQKYVIWPADDRPTDNGLPVSAQTVYFLTYEKSNIHYLKSDELDKINVSEKNIVIIPIYFDLNLLHKISKQFSKSEIEIIGLNTGIVIVP